MKDSRSKERSVGREPERKKDIARRNSYAGRLPRDRPRASSTGRFERRSPVSKRKQSGTYRNVREFLARERSSSALIDRCRFPPERTSETDDRVRRTALGARCFADRTRARKEERGKTLTNNVARTRFFFRERVRSPDVTRFDPLRVLIPFSFAALPFSLPLARCMPSSRT